jgi:hypothetical protein
MSTDGIIGLIFLKDTVNSERYRVQIVRPFFEQPAGEEHQYAFFQQNSATIYTARACMDTLRELIGDRILAVVCGQHTTLTSIQVTFIYGEP